LTKVTNWRYFVVGRLGSFFPTLKTVMQN